MKALFVIAGHGWGDGGRDDGAHGHGTNERKEVVEIAKELLDRIRLDSRFNGIEIVPIGIFERLTLKSKIALVNEKCRTKGWTRDDARLIDIHINSAGSIDARGVESWVDLDEGALDFGKAIVEAVASATELPVRRYPVQDSEQNRWGRLGIIDDTIPVACLIECGFITNYKDASAFLDEQLDDKFADGIRDGIADYLGLVGLPEPPSWYTDVAESAWYYKDLKLCVQEGLYVVPPNGRFNPTTESTRAVTVMARHLRTHHNLELRT